MDSSNDYIEMCREAKELQEGRSDNPYGFLNGDFFVRGVGYDLQLVYWDRSWIGTDSVNLVWLPRQDQLVNLIDKEKPLSQVFEDDYEIIYGRCLEESSLEKTWLIILMLLKYQKMWNGKTWHTVYVKN